VERWPALPHCHAGQKESKIVTVGPRLPFRRRLGAGRVPSRERARAPQLGHARVASGLPGIEDVDHGAPGGFSGRQRLRAMPHRPRQAPPSEGDCSRDWTGSALPQVPSPPLPGQPNPGDAAGERNSVRSARRGRLALGPGRAELVRNVDDRGPTDLGGEDCWQSFIGRSRRSLAGPFADRQSLLRGTGCGDKPACRELRNAARVSKLCPIDNR